MQSRNRRRWKSKRMLGVKHTNTLQCPYAAERSSTRSSTNNKRNELLEEKVCQIRARWKEICPSGSREIL